MGYRLRELEAERKFSSNLTLEAFADVLTQDTINSVLQQHHATEVRERKLCMSMVVWVLLAMNLYSNLSVVQPEGESLRGTRKKGLRGLLRRVSTEISDPWGR